MASSTLRPSPSLRLSHPPQTLKSSRISLSRTFRLPQSLKSTAIKLSLHPSPSPQTLKPQTFPSSPKPFHLFNPRARAPAPRARAYVSSSDHQIVPAKDRIISIIAYLLPFFNGLPYGYYLFANFPMLEAAFSPLVPLLAFYKSIPFVNLVAFFTLYVGIIRDSKQFSRYVRLNAYQSITMDMLFVLPFVLGSVLNLFEVGEGIVTELMHSAVFLVFLGLFLYNVICCVFGKRPRYPHLSDLLDWRLSAEDRFFESQ